MSYASAYGEIHSGWTVKGNTATWHVTIPANTTGRLSLTRKEAAKYKLDGEPLTGTQGNLAHTLLGQESRSLSYRANWGSTGFTVELSARDRLEKDRG